MKTKKEIFKYIQNTTNWQIIPNNIAVNVPLYLKAGYELWGAKMQGISVVFVSVRDENIDIRVHQNAIKRLVEITSCHGVLVFERLNARGIESLIKKHIAFIIKDKQIYMPFALLQIRTPNLKKVPLREVSLNSDADMILIGYLNNKIKSGFIIKEITEVIDRELRATSKALKLLEALGYIQMETKGRSKYIYFIPPIEIYDRLKEEAKLPIKYTFFAKNFVEETIFSGYTALANYSTLIDNKIKTVAIFYKQFSTQQIEALECNEDEATCKIEVWDRDPSIFAHNNTINPLYVLRFFKNHEDERVQEAIEQIETKIIEKFKVRDERN